MCGIAAYVGRRDWLGVSDMLTRLRHRGPDEAAVSNAGDCTLGHVRLSIIDAAGGKQPMWNPDHSVCIVFNGEIYNFEDLRRRLFSNRRFASRSDSEVLLALIERYGSSAPEHLDGMFAFVAVREGEVLAARDRLGVKPLFMSHNTDDTTLFASERWAFPDSAVIEEFPPGQIFSSMTGFRQYHEMHTSPLCESSEQTILANIRTLLTTAVSKRLIAYVPVGILLSGGLDSSIIAALMSQEQDTVHSFTVGIEGAPDLIAAREVAAHLGTLHHEETYNCDQMLCILPHVIRHLEAFDQPLVRSAIPNWFLARLAARHVKVVLTGEGADELFAGYDRYDMTGTDSSLSWALLDSTAQLHNTNLQRADRMSMAFSVEARVPYLDTSFVEYAHRVPAQLKRHGGGVPAKRLLKEAFRDLLPSSVLDRRKLKFSEGAGSADLLDAYSSDIITDAEFVAESRQASVSIRSKEELLYYRYYVLHFGVPASNREIGRTPMPGTSASQHDQHSITEVEA